MIRLRVSNRDPIGYIEQFGISGIALAKRIFEINPIASIIIITSHKEDFFKQFESIPVSGKVLDMI